MWPARAASLCAAHVEDALEAPGTPFDAVALRATHAGNIRVGNPCVLRRLGLSELVTQAGARSGQDGAGSEGQADGSGSHVSTHPRAASLVIGPLTTLRTTPSGPMKNCVGRAYTR